MKQYLIPLIACLWATGTSGQNRSPEPYKKINHAEPLFADLVKDLGVKKGEKELNLGVTLHHDGPMRTHGGFLEYEFSPVNRLGLEIEIPFGFSRGREIKNQETVHKDKIEGVKMSSQYTFLISPAHQTSAALGMLYEINLHSIQTFSATKNLLKGSTLNPFVIVAKKWNHNIHSLMYTGPSFEKEFRNSLISVNYQFNMSLHYVLTGSHFIGLELNSEFSKTNSSIVFHPQVKLKIANGLAAGFVIGVPSGPGRGNLDFMTRLIIEPRQKKSVFPNVS